MEPSRGEIMSFEEVAADYDQTRHIPAEICAAAAKLCVSDAKVTRAGLVLDAGIGTGRFGAPVARLCPGRVVGVDIAPAMMALARDKVEPGALSLAQADLRHLPFRRGAFQAVLIVHILHLVAEWTDVLAEARRVLDPRGGTLLLGLEQTTPSQLVAHYYMEARRAGVLGPRTGAGSFTTVLTHIKKDKQARVSQVGRSELTWIRRPRLRDTLDALGKRTYSQMWPIPDSQHQELLDATRNFALTQYATLDAAEELRARFSLYSVRWPVK